MLVQLAAAGTSFVPVYPNTLTGIGDSRSATSDCLRLWRFIRSGIQELPTH
jgi:hypothetical protein